MADVLGIKQYVEADKLARRAKNTGLPFEPYAKKFYRDWQKSVAGAIEPLTGVWQQLGFDLNPELVAAAYVAHNLGALVEMYENTSRNVLESGVKTLFTETLADWPRQLASDVIGEAQHVQNQ